MAFDDATANSNGRTLRDYRWGWLGSEGDDAKCCGTLRIDAYDVHNSEQQDRTFGFVATRANITTKKSRTHTLSVSAEANWHGTPDPRPTRDTDCRR